MALSNDERDRAIMGVPSDMPEDTIMMDDDPMEGDLIENDDGSAEVVVSLDDDEYDTEFHDNLVETLKPQVASNIAAEFIELVSKDKEARKKRDEQYEDGLRRTGLGDDAPGGAQFNGASKVVHPMLAEACVDFEARAIKELFPSGGPVRTSILSNTADENVEIAELKRDILNLQFTRTIPEYRDELESLLSQLPMGGSQYMKIWWDGKRKRTEFVPIDHVYLPFSCTNFYTSPRITHAQMITRSEFERRIREGLYTYDLDTIDSDMPQVSASEAANNKIEGREDDAYNEDGLRLVYEISAHSIVDTDTLTEGEYAPYLYHIDEHTGTLLGLYRNWEEDDANYDRLHWLVEFGFIPWRGAYKIGLPHLIGGLSGAATGALRALLDSAHQANAPTLLKLKAGRMVGQTTEVAVTQVQEIEGPSGIDDIRKLVSPVPFAGPNGVLFQLLGFLVETGKGVVSTAEEKIADVSDRMPVGTALAMIEQGSKVFAAIHQRLHASQAKVMEVLCRLNAKYPEEDWDEQLGRPVDPAIFRKTDDIVPVSDPNIFSEAQRFAQMQAVMQLMADPTVNYNRIEAHTRMLKLLNVPQPEQLLPTPPKPKKADPVQENIFAVSGIPLKAFPEQDHLAHIETHLRFILSPALGNGPAYSGQQLSPLLAHVGEHYTMYYPQAVAEAQAMAITQGRLLPDTPKERMQTVGMAAFDAIVTPKLQPILQMLAQAQQTVQGKMPKPPMDPQIQATMQIAQMEDAREKAKMQAKQQMDAMTAQSDQASQQFEMQLAMREQQHSQQMDQIKAQSEARSSQMEMMLKQKLGEMSQQVEMLKNEQDNKQHQMTELMKNRDDNQTQLLITQMKGELDSLKQSTSIAKPQDDTMLREMQRLLGELKDAKTNSALEAVVQGLQTVIGGQQDHQSRMLEAASMLVRGQ